MWFEGLVWLEGLVWFEGLVWLELKRSIIKNVDTIS